MDRKVKTLITQLESLSKRIEELENDPKIAHYLEYCKEQGEMFKLLNSAALSEGEFRAAHWKFMPVVKKVIDYAGIVQYLEESGRIAPELIEKFTGEKTIGTHARVKDSDFSLDL